MKNFKNVKNKPKQSFFYPLSAIRYPLAIFLITPFLCGFQFYSTLKNEEGNTLYDKGQVGKAKSAYESALKSEPSSPEIAFNLGNAYYKETSFDKSVDAYKKAAEAKKSPLLQSKAFYNLGNSLVRRKETDKAIEFYKQALRLDPKDEDAKYNLELLSQRENQQQKQQQDKQDQKQNQGGNQGSGDQGQKDQKENQDRQEKQEESQGSGQKQQDDQKDKQKEGREEKKQNDQSAGDKSKEGEREGKQEESQDQSPRPADQSEEGREEQRPKTQAEIRADQILNALENEEKQVLKMEGGQKSPTRKVQYLVDKDW